MARPSSSKTGPPPDYRRALELSRYLTAEDLVRPDAISHDTSSISTHLAPLCQLVALQCRAPKVLLNVMTKDTMYFLSEASTPDENDESAKDPVMRACSGSVPLEGRVCEMTIRAGPDDVVAPFFIVNDLANSEFRQLSAVSEPPHYRFYAGTPITTRDGITIGSLAFMDVVPRGGLKAKEESCLIRTAATAMLLFESHRAANEGKRSVRLARTLEAFLARDDSVSGRAPSNPQNDFNAYVLNPPSKPPNKEFANQTAEGAAPQPHLRRKSYASPAIGTPDLDHSAAGGRGSPSPTRPPQSRLQILERATKLMYRGFACSHHADLVAFLSLKNPVLHHATREHQPAQVLAVSRAPRESNISSDTPEIILSNDALGDLVQRYPTGCIFLLNHSTVSSNAATNDDTTEHEDDRDLQENRVLRAAFPHAKQVLFVPLWDAEIEAYSCAAMVAMCSENLSLSPTIELSFLHSYCSSVSAEISRVNALKADKQKSDFVRTISHEMRSPLHGMLASADFLNDTILSDYQKALVNTVHSCSRTLLDTIEHVLDFSKISTFQKKWHSEKRQKRLSGAENNVPVEPSASTPALLQLKDAVDIAVILEEVVDSLVLGHHYASVSAIDIEKLSMYPEDRDSSVPTDVYVEQVPVTIAIQPANWTFLAQPGAIRRIILNIVGNALKYTTRGCIRVSLAQEGDELDTANTMTLKVVDTGQGMGEKYLNTLLFVPFAQENDLAPGTGLGLSIVHDIVIMLGGTVDVQSAVGVGTTITVILPLRRGAAASSLGSTIHGMRNTLPSQPVDADDAIQWLRRERSGTTFAFYTASTRQQIHSPLSGYLEDWYKFASIQKTFDARIVITDAEHLESLQRDSAMRGRLSLGSCLVVALCSVASRRSGSQTDSTNGSNVPLVEWVQRPVGPNKLARAIRSGLLRIEKASQDTSRGPTAKPASSPIASSTSVKGLEDTLHSVRLDKENGSGREISVQSAQHMPISQAGSNGAKIPSTLLATSGTRETRTTAHPVDNSNRKATREPRILVVEDNMVNLGLLKSFLLRKRHYSLLDCAINGQEAVDVFVSKDGAYDIIFMDISMPIMDGFDATRLIREAERTHPEKDSRGSTLIVALTGLSSSRDQAQGLEAGMDIYMTKPVSFKAVGQLLDDWESEKRDPK